MNKVGGSIRELGFCRIKNIFLNEDLNCCESMITSMIEKEGFFRGLLKSDMSGDSDVKQQQLEILRPSLLSVSLRKSPVYKQCYSIAKEYFGGSAYYLFDHAIFKMPNSTTITPWHQDQAYLGGDVIIPSLHFWIPFQDTDIDNGAMQFAMDSHYNFVPHTLAYPENSHVLRVINEPQENICCMNINRGDVSLHTNLTLHCASSNKSNSVRKAWIIHFGQKPEWYKRILKAKRFFSRSIYI